MATRGFKQVDSLFQHEGGQRIRVLVQAGDVTPWYPVAPRGWVTVQPGAGGTMSVEETGSPLPIVLADNANGASNAIAETWDAGTASAVASEGFDFCTAIRFRATTAAGIGEIAT